MASVASTVRCRVVVPAAVTATGVCAASPNSVSPLATSDRCEAVACSTSTPGRGGQPRPVDAGADVGLEVRRPDRHAGVGGHRGAGGHPGHDVERHPGGGHRDGLLDHRVDGQRVAADQPGDPAAVPGLGDQVLGDVGGLPDRRPHLGVRRRHGQDRLGHVRVGDDQRRGDQGLAGAHGQQAGVAGATAHELDPPWGDGWCSVHLGTLISGAGNPAIRWMAAGSARSSSSAASARPTFSASCRSEWPTRAGARRRRCRARPAATADRPRGRRRRGRRRHRRARRPGRCSPLPGRRAAPVPR